MNVANDLKLFGIIGHPIGQSLSPLMHNTAFEDLGMKASMSAFDIAPESLKEALQGFATLEFGGINVTIPHKETIMQYLDTIDEEASTIGAVNTVRYLDGRTSGFNTDAYGFLKTLEPFRSSVEGGKFVVLGAGGAARAVVYVLLKFFRTSQIVIASRSTSRTTELVEHFKSSGQLALTPFDLNDSQFGRIFQVADVVVNATPAGMFPSPKQLPFPNPSFQAAQTVVDLIYRPMNTLFLQLASQAGARIISGLEMFIHQGARAFQIWTGQSMNTELVRRILTRKLEQEV
jgi:shikimate dehydrogenase